VSNVGVIAWRYESENDGMKEIERAWTDWTDCENWTTRKSGTARRQKEKQKEKMIRVKKREYNVWHRTIG